ncbi:marvel domain-containing protein [Xylariaceae sp. FL0594]|nr:marvel domain-containing protein [Xylariaceae sp. FL0594]
MVNVAAAALRGFLLIFGAIILGLSVSLAKQQVIGSPPPETSFFSFAGAFGIVVAALGILAIFVDKIPTIGIMVADALASVFYIAGAIALTVALKPVSSCTSSSKVARNQRYLNKLLNGGCRDTKGGLFCPNAGPDTKHFDSYTSGRCQQVQADYVFGYIAFAFSAASIIITFLTRGRRGTTATYV